MQDYSLDALMTSSSIVCCQAQLKLQFNYNFDLSWDVYILNLHRHQPPTHPEKYGITSASTANFDYIFNYNF